MTDKKLLLASQSPRRRDMITWLNIPVNVTQADIDEDKICAKTPLMTAVELARAKARAITAHNGDWILAADTIVDLEQVSLGKPNTPEQAYKTLQKLRERPHWVHTGVALYHPIHKTLAARYVSTQVWMRPYTDTEIKTYVASGDPMDKAGAYAIQNVHFHPVDKIQRCYANVVGLPLCATVELLQLLGDFSPPNVPQLCLSHFGYHCPAKDKGISQ